MMHPPAQPKKRRAGAPRVPPAGVVKMEAEEAASGDGSDPPYKHVKAVHPSSPTPQDMYGDLTSEPPPLGLQLRKSPSFVDLIESILSKARYTPAQPVMEDIISLPPMKTYIKSRALTAGERLKASNFPGTFLKIGNWEYTSQHEGDLVAKCYYPKHKLVWEVLDAGLKSKVELQWSQITALKATCPEEGDGILDIVLSGPPIFFQETDPQPRKHTLWQPTSDFTGGQASMHRRHILRCSSSLLSRNFEKLIQCDQRLYQLSQQPVIILDPLIFEARNSIFENPNESSDPSPKFTHLASPCVVSSVFNIDGVKPLMLKQPECFSRPINLGFAASHVQASCIAQEQQSPDMCSLAVQGLRSSMSMDDLAHHIDNYITEQKAAGDTPSPNTEVTSKELLEIAESLLSDTHGSSSTDDEYFMARVDSFSCLLQKDTAPAAISISKHSDTVYVGEVGSDDFDGTEEGAFISRKDSFADMLENLPRVASVSQFLFDIAQDFENSISHSQD